VKGIFTVVGAILFIAILSAMIVLIMSTFTNYMNTMQTVQQQHRQILKLLQQLQQGLTGWINTSATSAGRAWINATIYNVGLVTVNLTSILVIWPNNTATPIEKLAYTVSFTPPTCGSNTIINGKLAIGLQPACRVDLNIRADVDSETAKYINLTRIVAIGYTFTAGSPTPISAQTTLQLQHYKLTKTPTPTTTTTPTPILRLAKRHAIAWDTFDTDPFAEGKLYILCAEALYNKGYNKGTTSYDWNWDWSNGRIWLNTTAFASVRGSGYSSIWVVLSTAINLAKYNPKYPEINKTIADKVFIIANVTMLNRINIDIVPETLHGYGEVDIDTEEYLVFSNTTRPSSNYYALGGYNHTDMLFAFSTIVRTTSENLTIVAVSSETPSMIAKRQLQTALLTNRTATLEALYDSQNASYPLLMCVLVNQTYRECLSSSNEYNIFPATAGFQSSTWIYVGVGGGSVSAEGYTNVSVDWFVLSLNATPEYINITGLGVGWSVELYDGDRLVASAVAGYDGVARLFVAFHPIVVEPRVVIRDSKGGLVADIRLGEVMVGGDVWMFSFG